MDKLGKEAALSGLYEGK